MFDIILYPFLFVIITFCFCRIFGIEITPQHNTIILWPTLGSILIFLAFIFGLGYGVGKN